MIAFAHTQPPIGTYFRNLLDEVLSMDTETKIRLNMLKTPDERITEITLKLENVRILAAFYGRNSLANDTLIRNAMAEIERIATC